MTREPARRGRLLLGVAGLAGVLLLGGCYGSASGGGWIQGSTANQRTNIGFDFTCGPESSGSLSFVNRAVGVNALISIDTCDVMTEAAYEGTYVMRPRGGSGDVRVVLHDTGAVGPSKGDQVTITFETGPLAEQDFGGQGSLGEFAGTLDGGNITAENWSPVG